jgi:transcriptional regulator with XRE-family HTH domain
MDEIAKRAGMSTRQQWYGVESGQRANVTPDTLYAVAKALGVTMDSLMLQDQDPQPKAKAKRRPK